MAKKPVTMAMRDEDLKALDEFAVPRRLSRGDAVGVLLEERQASPIPSSPKGGPDVTLAEAGDIAKAIKAEALKQALRLTEKRLGVAPVQIEGDAVVQEPTSEKTEKDPMDQSVDYEYADDPSPDVQDQRRKGKR